LTVTLSRHERGQLAELKAAGYLQQQGLKLIKQNFRARGGEIDLIMSDNDIIIFVEVRFRKSPNFMHAIETIDATKVQRIIQASRYFLQTESQKAGLYRFDTVTLTGNINTPVINWTKNAFFDE